MGARREPWIHFGSDELSQDNVTADDNKESTNIGDHSRIVMLTMSCHNILINIIPTLYAGYIVSAHIIVVEKRPVDPGSIQGSHPPISFVRIKYRTRANDLP